MYFFPAIFPKLLCLRCKNISCLMEIFYLNDLSVSTLKLFSCPSFIIIIVYELLYLWGSLFYPAKFVSFGWTIGIHRLRWDICFGRDSPYYLLYEWNNAFDCNEMENEPLEFLLCDSRLIALNDVRYHFLFLYLFIVFSIVVVESWFVYRVWRFSCTS